MNYCFFVGNLTEDVKLTTVEVKKDGTSTKKSKGTLKIATNDFGRGKATFIELTVWEAAAENTAKYVKKGMPVSVMAHVENNNYEKDGKTVYSNEFVADKVEFISYPKSENKQAT